MMVDMHDVEDFFAEIAGGIVVEQEAVGDIFSQRPADIGHNSDGQGIKRARHDQPKCVVEAEKNQTRTRRLNSQPHWNATGLPAQGFGRSEP